MNKEQAWEGFCKQTRVIVTANKSLGEIVMEAVQSAGKDAFNFAWQARGKIDAEIARGNEGPEVIFGVFAGERIAIAIERED